MKALIIGGAGFVGGYLARHLIDDLGAETYVTKIPKETVSIDKAIVYDLDIMEPDEISGLLASIRPDCIYHLAAQSSVALSWKNPGLTVDINIKGSLNLLEAVRKLDYKPRLLMIGSGEEYGFINAEDCHVSEETILRPGNIYAATKACQNMISAIYARAYGIDVMMVRAFNHIGPNQIPVFVIADFCKQVADIENGHHEPVMSVGNLNAMRDFTDVRDVVRAYTLLMEKGKSGETYNVGSGKAISIKDALNTILSFSKVDINVVQDPNRLRPSDIPIIEADVTKLKACTGWEPEYSLEKTIKETLDYWREQ